MPTCANDRGQGGDPSSATWRRPAGVWSPIAAPFIELAHALMVLVRATIGNALARAGFAIAGLANPNRPPAPRRTGGEDSDGLARQHDERAGAEGRRFSTPHHRAGPDPGPSSGHERPRAGRDVSFIWPPVRPTVVADSVRYEVRALGLAARGVRARCTICGGPGPLVGTGGDGDGPQRRCEECLRAHLRRYTGPDGLDREVRRCLKRCRRGR